MTVEPGSPVPWNDGVLLVLSYDVITGLSGLGPVISKVTGPGCPKPFVRVIAVIPSAVVIEPLIKVEYQVTSGSSAVT